MAQIFLKVRDLYKTEGGKFPDPILNLTWPYYAEPEHPSLSELAKEINGKALANLTDPKTQQVVLKAGQQLPGFALLKDDGTTSCGNWIYSGSLDRGWTTAAAPRDGGPIRHGRLSELGIVLARQPARPL